MRLFFDARYTRLHHHDGVSRYTTELLAAVLQETRGSDIDVITMLSNPAQLAMLPPLAPGMWRLFSSPVSPREMLIARELNRAGADVVFSPMQVLGSWGRNFGLILTVHDLIYYSHPHPPRDLPALVRGVWRAYHLSFWPQRVLLNRADAIAAVSQTTAAQITRHKLTRRPVRVIANAGSSYTGSASTDTPYVYTAKAADSSASAKKRLVYMGGFMPYKNVETVITAMRYLPGWTLDVLSPISTQTRERLSALIPPGAEVIFHNGVSEDQYYTLLSSATALVSASLAEGFGLPIIEAMSTGTPVVVSDMEIFHEVTHGVAEFFNPHEPRDLARACAKLTDPHLWQSRATQGIQAAKLFSWAESARSLVDLARKVHTKRSGN